MSVRVYSVFVLSSVGSGLATGWSPVKSVLPTLYGLRNWKSGQGPKGCRATEREIYRASWVVFRQAVVVTEGTFCIELNCGRTPSPQIIYSKYLLNLQFLPWIFSEFLDSLLLAFEAVDVFLYEVLKFQWLWLYVKEVSVFASFQLPYNAFRNNTDIPVTMCSD
jgi:hypothetical protein